MSEGLEPGKPRIFPILRLSTQVGEKSPVRGFHVAMAAGAPGSRQADSTEWLRNPVHIGPERLAESRDGNERGNVTRPDGGEVPQVHRRNRDDPEPLADSDHRRIRAAEPEIRVLAHEGRHPPKVGVDKLHELEGAVRPRAHAVQEGGLGRRPQRPVDEVAGLGKDCRGDHEDIRRALEPVRGSRVMFVPAVGEGLQDIRVDEDHAQ